MRYAGTGRSKNNPLRSISLFPSIGILRPLLTPSLTLSGHVSLLTPVPAVELQRRELANAETPLCKAVRVFGAVRVTVADVKRETTATLIFNDKIVGSGIVLTLRSIRQLKALARRILNHCLAGMAVALGQVVESGVALVVPPIAEVEELAAKAAADEAQVVFAEMGHLTMMGQ